MLLRIAITGSSGLVGTKLVEFFEKRGDMVTRIVRSGMDEKPDLRVSWDIRKGRIEADALEDHDVVIHLAGANIAARRWTPQYKKKIIESRVKGTELLTTALAQLKRPPPVLLTASAVGFYGTDGMENVKDESSPSGEGFLSDVCRQWEKAADPAEAIGIRVVRMRIAAVLSTRAGALAKMLPAFQLGLGGKLGSGAQPMSWIALDEFPGIVQHLINDATIRGPVNLSAPETVTNSQFTRILGETLRRPAVFPMPPFGVQMLFGEMGEELLLKGANVAPKKLIETGYRFKHADLRSALRDALTTP